MGNLKNGKNCVVSGVKNHATTPSSDGCAVNIAPLQLGEKLRRIHGARLNEALVPAAVYLDAHEMESACNVSLFLHCNPAAL
jgi:hypothetical protein